MAYEIYRNQLSVSKHFSCHIFIPNIHLRSHSKSLRTADLVHETSFFIFHAFGQVFHIGELFLLYSYENRISISIPLLKVLKELGKLEDNECAVLHR